MSRACGMCGHPARRSLEERIVRGEPIRRIAVDARGLSESAIRRHVKHHLGPELREQLRSAEAQMRVTTMTTRLIELADVTADVRSHAEESKDYRLLLQAISSERDTLGLVAGRLGIDSSDVLDEIEMAQAVLRALKAVLPGHLHIAREFADFFASEGLHGYADDFYFLAKKADRHLEAKRTEATQ